MPKSLYGQDQEKLQRESFQRERYTTPTLVEATIIKVFTCYKDFEDSSSEEISEIKELLEISKDEKIVFNSGVHFFVRTEDRNFTIIPSPKTEDELRCLYGSDANLLGRKIVIKTLNKDLNNISKKDIVFQSSENMYLQDNDAHLPINIGSFYGSSINTSNKMNAFQLNRKSKAGIFYEQ
jgi:hypothetical protein